MEELDIDRPVFAKYDSDICADHMSIALLNHPSLKRLSARFHNITDYGASLIARSLCSRINMISLNLSWYVFLILGYCAVQDIFVFVF
jgi:hypothetical protein